MKKFNIHQLILFTLLNIFTLTSFAWNNSIELGYGVSHDPNHTKYNNSGLLLSADLYPFYRSPKTFWSLNGALGQWYTTAPHNKNLTTAALALALRYYPFVIKNQYPSYLLASAGPAYLSSRHFGANTQGKNITFQCYAGLGVEFDQIDVNFRLAHYSNAYLARPDQGFTILYMLSIGYLF